MSNNTWISKQVTVLDGNYTGAMAGIFDLEEPVEQILGTLDPGKVFLYLFRRFGYPQFGWDGKKTLVKYYLSTPMDGVILEVRPDVTGAGTFGYMLRENLDQLCVDEEASPFREWQARREAWVLQEHGIEIINIFEQDTVKIKRVWDKWAADKEDSDFENQAAVDEAFLYDQETIRVKCENLYEEIDPFPKQILIQDRDDSSIIKQCHTALCDAIRDLERPVYVRDVLFNITGELPKLNEEPDNIIQYSHMAGVGVGDRLEVQE